MANELNELNELNERPMLSPEIRGNPLLVYGDGPSVTLYAIRVSTSES